MNQSKQCPRCGAKMIGESEECPACLMRQGFTPTASEAIGEDGLPLTQSIASGESAATTEQLRADTDIELDLDPGQRFGNYRIVQRLGRGGMGVVYEADDLESGRRVALKVLSHSLDDPKARARFLREGRLAASINHPNSVYVFGTEEIGKTPTISMELIRGGTLQQLVKARGPMPARQAVDAVLQVIDGLEAADRKGVLHRDIKPANCFVDASGLIKIGDFGLSISTGPRDAHEVANVTREGTFLGTPSFASPEQLRGDSLDTRSDVYSVGVTLFYLLTGEPPFAGKNMIQLLATVLDKPAPPVRSIREDVPEELDRVIARCLQKSAGQRYSSYAALREALLPLSSHTATPAALGNRLLASLIDNVLWSFIGFFLAMWWVSDRPLSIAFGPGTGMSSALFMLATLMLTIGYYAVCEWRFATTLGKYCLGLRVIRRGGGSLTVKQAIGRASLFLIIPSAPNILLNLIAADWPIEVFQRSPWLFVASAIGYSYYLLLGSLFLTARRTNGFAAVHDLLTDTRVVNRVETQPSMESASDQDSFDVDDRKKLGPYHLLDTLRDVEGDRLSLGYDARLLRRVWIHEQPVGSDEVGKHDRNLSRVTRLRWLGARRSDTECWDCYEGPGGAAFLVAVNESMNWNVARNLLRELATELQTACKEEDFPSVLALDRLWITDDHHIKLLPLKAPVPEDFSSDSATHERKLASDDESEPIHHDGTSIEARTEAGLQLFKRAARVMRRSFDVAAPASTMPLSGSVHLQHLANADSWDAVDRELRDMSLSRIVDVSRRIAGLLAASYALPAMILFFSLIMGFLYYRESNSMPEVKELGQISFLMKIESSRFDETQQKRLTALERYTAGNFDDLLADQIRMNSIYAMATIPQQNRPPLLDAIRKHDPTDQQLAEATELVQQIRGEHEQLLSQLSTTPRPTMLLMSAVFSWIFIVYLPSLVTAILCRGGLLMRIFGLTLVDRRGQHASRFRVLVRMTLAGLPMIAILLAAAMSFGTEISLNHEGAAIAKVWLIGGAIAVCLFAVIFRTRHRLFSDRLAGTVIVAK